MPLLLILLFGGVLLYTYRQQVADALERLIPPPEPRDLTRGQIEQAAATQAQQLIQASGQQLSELQKKELAKWQSIATIAGTTTAIGISSFSSLTLASAGPIGAAIAAIIVTFGFLRGTAHLVANVWVKEVQNPFDQVLFSIINEKDRAIQTGVATRASIAKAKQAVISIWARYEIVAEQFAQQGKDYRLVIDQSYCWYVARRCPRDKFPDPRFPEGFINRVLNDMDRDYTKLSR